MSEAPNSNYLPPKVTYAILGTGNTVDYIRADLVAGMRDALEAAISELKEWHRRYSPVCAKSCYTCKMVLPKLEAALEAGKVDG